MCGITGAWAPASDERSIRANAEQAVARLRHRGPDDRGIWSDGTGVVLGHTRLSILDLSERGHQPMSTPDGRFTIVYNGEIYNFADIRRDLVAAGHSFEGTGDTEVILHAFAEWGHDTVHRFIGMFAIALWDSRERELLLVRDRLGVKPLYYAWDGRTLCFGSELKALLAYEHWKPEIDLEALGEFLQFGYISGPRTIWRGAHKLEPGRMLVLREGGQPVVKRYWEAAGALEHPLDRRDERELEAELESLLIDAFRHRLVSDVPVGVYLSGGVDSSLVTALLTAHGKEPIRTFTIGFEETTHDEARWAKAVARHCGSLHTEYVLRMEEGVQIAKDWGKLFDEPFGDSSGIPTLLVSRLASREVKVVLSADGGDELFSGYNVYSLVLRRLEQLEKKPQWVTRPVGTLAAMLPAPAEASLPGKGRRTLLARAHRLGAMLQEPGVGRLMTQYLTTWQPDAVRRLIGHYASPRADASRYPGHPATQMSLWDIDHYLPEDILTKVDRTTMAVSIEGREPLLDHRIVHFALALPLHLRRGALGPKHLAKSILYRYVPREMVDRPKHGFGVPLVAWLRAELRELVRERLAPERIRAAGLMDPAFVDSVVRRFYAGDDALGRPVWLLLAFELWRENWT
jgi:asparagine synthase (glutamine-hydrolysing)